jgi:hypothetical protein
MALLSHSKSVGHRRSRGGVVSEVRELAAQLRAALASADPGSTAGPVCGDIAEELAATEKACAAARLRYAVRATDCGEHARRGFTDPNAWIARTAGS